MSPSSSTPPPESPDIFMPPVEGRLFDPKLARRLQSAKGSTDPLIRESANTVLSAERDLVEALMIIHDLRSLRKADPQTKPATEAKVIQFPVSRQPEPTSDLNTAEPADFQPVVYKNETSELEPGDEDSGLEIITAGEEADEKACKDFGLDEAQKEEPDEWDALYCRIKELEILDNIVKKTGSRDVHQLAEKLRKNPNFYMSGKGKGRKN